MKNLIKYNKKRLKFKKLADEVYEKQVFMEENNPDKIKCLELYHKYKRTEKKYKNFIFRQIEIYEQTIQLT